jgi:hypothetical protein
MIVIEGWANERVSAQSVWIGIGSKSLIELNEGADRGTRKEGLK